MDTSKLLLSRRQRSMIDLSQVTALRKYVQEFSGLETDYIFSHLSSSSNVAPIVSGSLNINGLIFCFVAKGYMKIDINLNSYTVTENTVVTASSSSLLSIREIDRHDLDAYVLIISPEFMRDINLDINVLQQSTKMNRPARSTPVFKTSAEESELLLRYLELLHYNTVENQDNMYIRSISRCLIASMTYQLLQFAAKRNPVKEEDTHPMTRRSNYVNDFIDLLHQYHKSERSVAFYADRLFITPKYLSLIVKETTGRSAAEWIDEYVILEAKNLLRYSRKNIQQIAYELNFSNQSSFGKYFKNLTGMSPSAYQRS